MSSQIQKRSWVGTRRYTTSCIQKLWACTFYDKEARKYNFYTNDTKQKALKASELRKVLDAHNINSNEKVPEFKKRCQNHNIPIVKDAQVVKSRYVGKPKGALQIAYEHGFINEEKENYYGIKVTMDRIKMMKLGKYIKILVWEKILGQCQDFLEETTKLESIVDELGYEVRLILIVHL